jgi:hypothetical protein
MITTLLLLLFVVPDDGIAVGPEPGTGIPSLKTFQVHGDLAGKEVDWKTQSPDHPILFVFLRSDQWDRPLARVVKKLDDLLQADRQQTKADLAIIWITKDLEKGKEYLPRAQQSLKLQASSWNILAGEVYDAQGWVLSGDLPLNLILVKKKKIAWGRAYREMSDVPVRGVRTALWGEKK